MNGHYKKLKNIDLSLANIIYYEPFALLIYLKIV